MSKKVLIVTNSSDLHADLIVSILVAKGHTPFRLNLDQFPRDYQLCQQFAKGEAVNMLRSLADTQWLSLDDIGAIWLRKPAEFAYLSDDLSVQERSFAKQETEQALFGVLYSLDCYWISHPLALRGSQWKGEQLVRAVRMGFRVPASIVTNCPAQVRAFRAALPGQMIFKAMSSPNLGSEGLDPADRSCDALPTTIVTAAMLECLDAVSEVPCHFQEYIAKQYELRVTIIGERVFAAKIYSQDDQRTAVDSRNLSAEVRYEACTLPPEVEQKCVAFVRTYGLNYGALDLIVTPEGDYVFLENNPVGQFLYIEQLIPQFNMLDTLATKLIKEAQCRSQT